MRTLALIPAYNEAANLPAVVAELGRDQPGLEVLIVDDASTDNTSEVLAKLGTLWLELGQHVGLGGAVRSGLRFARGLGFDCVVRLDADGQHRAADVEQLLGPIVAGRAEATVGTRFHEQSGYRATLPRRTAQRFLALALTRITGLSCTDPTSGFWAFGPAVMHLLGDHHPRGYSEPELRLFLHRNRLRVEEVAVEMRSRRQGRSTLTLRRASLAVARAGLAMIVVPFRTSVRRAGDD